VSSVQTPSRRRTERCPPVVARWHAWAVEHSTLDRARAGDERAFRELTEPYRLELQVHCYRMLGSLTDAEDMLQETLLAAWRGLGGFQARASVRSWLYCIATNRCLNLLRDAGRRVPTEPTPPFDPPSPTRRGEVTWLQPYPQALLAGLPDSAPGPEARYQTSEAVELAHHGAAAAAAAAGGRPDPAGRPRLHHRRGRQPAQHHADRDQGHAAARSQCPGERPRGRFRGRPAGSPGHGPGARAEPTIRGGVHSSRCRRRGRAAHRRRLALHAPGTARVPGDRRDRRLPASLVRAPGRTPGAPRAGHREHPTRLRCLSGRPGEAGRDRRGCSCSRLPVDASALSRGSTSTRSTPASGSPSGSLNRRCRPAPEPGSRHSHPSG